MPEKKDACKAEPLAGQLTINWKRRGPLDVWALSSVSEKNSTYTIRSVSFLYFCFLINFQYYKEQLTLYQEPSLNLKVPRGSLELNGQNLCSNNWLDRIIISHSSEFHFVYFSDSIIANLDASGTSLHQLPAAKNTCR